MTQIVESINHLKLGDVNMKPKTKRYDGEDGSLVEDESDRGSMTAEQQANSDTINAAAKPQSFKEAFAKGRAEALAGGNKTFTWNGKSYGTDLASSKPATKTFVSKEDSQPKSYADMAKNIPEGTSEAARQALMANVVKEKQKKDEEAKKNEKPAISSKDEEAKKNAKPAISSKYDTDISGSDLDIRPSDMLKKAKERASQTRTEMPSGKKIREMLDLKYKSGGPVRSSASKRGDGIATKGHTKGRYM